MYQTLGRSLGLQGKRQHAPTVLIPGAGEPGIDQMRSWSPKAGGPRGCHWDTQKAMPRGSW